MAKDAARHIDPLSFPHEKNISEQIRFILRYGLLAPSVHNTQPWRFKLLSNTLEIFAEPSSVLQFGDPIHRELWLSMGCLLENISIVATHFGLKISSFRRYERLQRNHPLLTLSFTTTKPHSQDLLSAIPNRVTDRSIYQSREIPSHVLGELKKVWQSSGTEIAITTDPDNIQTIAELSARGISIALSNPQFRQELSKLIRSNVSRKKDGMPAYVLEVGRLSSFLYPRKVKSERIIEEQANKEQKMLQSAGGFVLIFTSGDVPKYWLEAGRAYQRLSLAANQLGLSHSTTAAIVEAADFHLDIEKLYKTDKRLQAVLRIGYSRKKKIRHSPRFEIDELVLST